MAASSSTFSPHDDASLSAFDVLEGPFMKANETQMQTVQVDAFVELFGAVFQRPKLFFALFKTQNFQNSQSSDNPEPSSSSAAADVVSNFTPLISPIQFYQPTTSELLRNVRLENETIAKIVDNRVNFGEPGSRDAFMQALFRTLRFYYDGKVVSTSPESVEKRGALQLSNSIFQWLPPFTDARRSDDQDFISLAKLRSNDKSTTSALFFELLDTANLELKNVEESLKLARYLWRQLLSARTLKFPIFKLQHLLYTKLESVWRSMTIAPGSTITDRRTTLADILKFLRDYTDTGNALDGLQIPVIEKITGSTAYQSNGEIVL